MTVAIRPTPGTPSPYHFPHFERRRLDNGVRLLIAPVHKLPIATVLVLVDAGAVTEPRQQEGVAQLAARALTEGTSRYDGELLTDRLEQLGTTIDTAADWDTTTVALTVLSEHLPEAFGYVADVLTTPTFPAAAVERIKGERIAEILQVESEPRELADEMFDAFVYAGHSRFAIPAGGTRTSVSAMTSGSVLDFYTGRYHPSAVTIIVAGDVDPDGVERLVCEALQGWTGIPVPSVVGDDTPARATRAVQIVHKGDAPQSELRLGHIGVPRTHPDYFTLTVANAVLGGLFSSRINLNLREAHGYTYGAHSAFEWRRAAGPFVVSTAVASKVTAEAVHETLYEIDRMRAEPISESELSLAVSYLDGVFPIRYETTAAIAAALATLAMYDLPDDWYDRYRDQIRAVTVDDVLRAMQTHLRPEQLQLVVVGDADTIRAPLEGLDFGPVAVRGTEQK